MSRSYRKPYYTWTSVGNSARGDKKLAARGMRHRQNQALRDCEDWNEFLIPEREECRHNNVYSWRRDGVQFPFQWNHNNFNPFWLNSSKYSTKTDDELVERMLERIEDSKKFLAHISRK